MNILMQTAYFFSLASRPDAVSHSDSGSHSTNLLTPTTFVALLSARRHTVLSGGAEDAVTFFMLFKRGQYVLLGMSQHIKEFSSKHFNKEQFIQQVAIPKLHIKLFPPNVSQSICRQERICLILHRSQIQCSEEKVEQQIHRFITFSTATSLCFFLPLNNCHLIHRAPSQSKTCI